eukprot:m.232633 g.232633  ORF g.232633 m.232633 type:complete len:192 (-) comp15235_c1_seq2:276-851(-)
MSTCSVYGVCVCVCVIVVCDTLWPCVLRRFGRHANGLTPQLRAKLQKPTEMTLKEFAAFPGIAGCQVKMLNGYRCAELVQVTAEMTNNAIKRLHEVAFVGLTDEWSNSICLFHAMFGGAPYQENFGPIRKQVDGGSSESSSKAGSSSSHGQFGYDIGTLSPEDDPHDWRLYEAAKALFDIRYKQYGSPHIP